MKLFTSTLLVISLSNVAPSIASAPLTSIDYATATTLHLNEATRLFRRTKHYLPINKSLKVYDSIEVATAANRYCSVDISNFIVDECEDLNLAVQELVEGLLLLNGYTE